jgi:hypothetical protein
MRLRVSAPQEVKMKAAKQAGLTVLEILLIIIAIGLVGLLMYYAGFWRVDVDSVELTVVPSTIDYGASGTATVVISYDKKASEPLKSTLQVWDDDFWEDDILINTRVTLFKGKDSITGTVALSCDNQGYLNGDSDEGDRVYKVYAYVVDSNGGTESSSSLDVTCAKPGE